MSTMSTKGEDIVGICYHVTTGEDAADWENLMCAVAICKVYKSVGLLELLVLMSYMRPINSVIDPNLMFTH
jgi:hypothetical protein